MKKFTKVMAAVMCVVLVLSSCGSSAKTYTYDGISYTVPSYYEKSADSTSSTETDSLLLKSGDEAILTIEKSTIGSASDVKNTGAALKFILSLAGLSTDSVKESDREKIAGYDGGVMTIDASSDTSGYALNIGYIANTDSGNIDLIVLAVQTNKDQTHKYQEDFEKMLDEAEAK